MLTFLRQLRRSLIGSGPTRNYFLYAFGEITLVVVGILIALQINNWNENRKIRNTEKQYLLALNEEFNFNRIELENIMARNKLNSEYAKKILNSFRSENSQITERMFGNYLTRSLSIETRFDPSLGVLDEIIHSGKLGIFSSKKLKFALSSWNGYLDRVRLQEQEFLVMRSRTIEMVRNEANLRKALGPALEHMDIQQSNFEKGNLHLLNSVAFEGHMTGFATMSYNLNNNYYPQLAEEIDKIIMLTDEAIE